MNYFALLSNYISHFFLPATDFLSSELSGKLKMCKFIQIVKDSFANLNVFSSHAD